MRAAPGLLLLAGAVALAACSAVSEPKGSLEQEAQPLDRLLIGKAATYPADTTLREREPELARSMAERRQAAWKIVEKVLAPVKIEARSNRPAESAAESEALSLPRFQTWYAREEILPMFDRLFRALPETKQRARDDFGSAAIADVFPWNATRATSLASFSKERLDARKQELGTALGAQSLGKDARVLLSPDYVAHLFESYRKIIDCAPSGNANVEDPNNFAPCLAGEFPVAAAAVKTRWMPGSAPVPTYDTSAAVLKDKLARGSFGGGDGLADPDATSAYTMRLTEDTTVRLVALHIMTKELRDWSWITLWWSPDADSDFGADRPSSITGPMAHYKMCVVTAYDEKDGAPGSTFARSAPTLAAALDITAGEGPATWCSNPYLETAEHSAKTNCIGCHQHGGTGETTETILGAPERFPDVSRSKVRTSFPADYAFTTEGGLDLSAEMRSRVEAIAP